MYSKYLIFGSIAKDEIMFFPGNFSDFLDPKQPDKLNFSLLVEDIKVQLGGIATNISYSLAQLINKPVYILGGVGSFDSQIFLDLFKLAKIKTDYLQIDEERISGTFKALTAQNNNQIGGFYYGANLKAKNINLSKIEDIQSSLLTLSANHPEAFYEIQNQAINLKLDYLYDPGMALSWIEKDKLIQGCINSKYLIINDSEADVLFKNPELSIQNLTTSGVSVIITKGSNGLEYYSKAEKIELKALPNIKVTDPTAAGDNFRAGFLAGLENGMQTKEALAFGSAAASFSLEHHGGVNHCFETDEIENRKSKILEISK
jgi:adenosine kinase